MIALADIRQRHSKAYVYLLFWGEGFSPKDFSVAIDLEGTRTGLKGEKGQYGAFYKESFWEYQFEETDDITGLAASLKQMQYLFQERVSTISQYRQNCDISARCTIVVSIREEENPGVFFDVNFLALIYQIGASIEVDMLH